MAESDWSNWDDYYVDEEYWPEDMDTFAMMDMYMDHVYEVCPEKMDSANEWAEVVDFEWTPEKLEDEAKQWAENNDCLGDEDLDKSGSDWSNWDDYYGDEEYWSDWSDEDSYD